MSICCRPAPPDERRGLTRAPDPETPWASPCDAKGKNSQPAPIRPEPVEGPWPTTTASGSPRDEASVSTTKSGPDQLNGLLPPCSAVPVELPSPQQRRRPTATRTARVFHAVNGWKREAKIALWIQKVTSRGDEFGHCHGRRPGGPRASQRGQATEDSRGSTRTGCFVSNAAPELIGIA